MILKPFATSVSFSFSPVQHPLPTKMNCQTLKNWPLHKLCTQLNPTTVAIAFSFVQVNKNEREQEREKMGQRKRDKRNVEGGNTKIVLHPFSLCALERERKIIARSVTSKKLPNVSKSCPKMISLEK